MSLAVVDVDGDSKDDSIGRAGGQIVVLTATGIEAAVAGTDSKLLTDPKAQDAAGFVGAWDVDGVPGAEVVVATKELGGSASYKVWSWEDANLAVMSPPASLYEGNPVEWKLHRGEGAETAVRCTGDPSRPIEVWNFTAPYGGSSSQPAMKVTSYSYDAANGGQFGDGSIFGDEQSFSGLDPAGWTRLILVSDQGKREDLTRWQRKITPKSSAATQSSCTATPAARP